MSAWNWWRSVSTLYVVYLIELSPRQHSGVGCDTECTACTVHVATTRGGLMDLGRKTCDA